MLKIDNRTIDENNSVFIVAELSANHNQDFKIAVKSIDAIKNTGADAVKLQTYLPESLTLNCDSDIFIRKSGLWKGKTLFDIYNQAYTPWEWQPELKKYAESKELICFSSPFDFSAVDFLEKMNMPAYKIASLEITDIPLIEYIASKGKPVIISTGIAELQDIEEAIEACNRVGNDQIILLKCTSAYPAPYDEINLHVIPELKKRFGYEVGLSDHTLGISIPIAGVALGAIMIEKHFILDRRLGGPDAPFSLEPAEFKEMVESIRQVEKALGSVTFKLTERALESKEIARSLFVVKDIQKGEILTSENIRSIRPGNGLHPRYYKDIVGCRARKTLKRGTPLSWDLIDKKII